MLTWFDSVGDVGRWIIGLVVLGGVAIAAQIVGANISHLLTVRRDRMNRYNIACVAFRDTVIGEAHKVTSAFSGDIGLRLERYVTAIDPAVVSFQHHLRSSKSKRAIAEDWALHKHHCRNEIPQACTIAASLYGDGSRAKAEKVFDHGVKSLLSYAKNI